MTPEQCRAARGLLDITRAELAEMSKVAEQVIGYFEAEDAERVKAMRAATLAALWIALERAGVEFIPEENGRGPGVRLRRATRSRK